MLISCPTRLLHPLARVPFRHRQGDAGYDVYCVAGLQGLENADNWDSEQLQQWEMFGETGHLHLTPGAGVLLRTGFAQAIPPGYAAYLKDRSGLGAKKCVHRLAGVIDSNFRGEWMVRLVNLGDYRVTIKDGDAIVQVIYAPVVDAEMPQVHELDDTVRGSRGFGSTDGSGQL